MTEPQIPMPPLSLRQQVGDSRERLYENPTGNFIWPLPEMVSAKVHYYYTAVYDFGCGCGRQARQLLLQKVRPERYLGVDIDPEAIRWCQENLSQCDQRFQFLHLDLYHTTYAPSGHKRDTALLPGKTGTFTLFNAHSVFTHLYWHQSIHYLKEAKRLIHDDGIIRTTWLFFDKRLFPQLSAAQHNVFLQLTDPTQAVFYDVRDTVEMWGSLGLSILDIRWPQTYGRPSVVFLGKKSALGSHKVSINPPETVPGGNLNEDLVGVHASGWRERSATKLSEVLNRLGVKNVDVDIASARLTVDREDFARSGDSIKRACEQFGFGLSVKNT